MNMLEIQVKALRAVAVATVAGCDAFLAMMLEAEQPPPEPTAEEHSFNPDPNLCKHPREAWKRIPAMGQPNRVMCRCGTVMEDQTS